MVVLALIMLLIVLQSTIIKGFRGLPAYLRVRWCRGFQYRNLTANPPSFDSDPLRNQQTARPRIPILRYDNDWVCVNKPAGMTVHRNRKHGRTQDLFVKSTLKRQLSRKVHPVHRLDHRTSGALLFAFNSPAAASLQAALNRSKSCKTYFAMLRGNWNRRYPDEEIVIDCPLEIKGVVKPCRTTFFKLAAGAVTIESADEDDCRQQECTLVLATPQTGRTHQIRRHAATSLGMPILGDNQHGDTKVNRWWRNHLSLDRLALHCLALDLALIDDDDSDINPEIMEPINIIAPLPMDLHTVMCRAELEMLWTRAVELEPRLATEDIDIRGGTLGIKKAWQTTNERDSKSRFVEAEPLES